MDATEYNRRRTEYFERVSTVQHAQIEAQSSTISIHQGRVVELETRNADLETEVQQLRGTAQELERTIQELRNQLQGDRAGSAFRGQGANTPKQDVVEEIALPEDMGDGPVGPLVRRIPLPTGFAKPEKTIRIAAGAER